MNTPPSSWYWGRLHDVQPPAQKAIGYYYIDKSAGRSFHVVVDVTSGENAADIKRTAAERNYRGEMTIRLGAHEEVFIDSLSPDDAAYLREEFDSPDGPTKQRVMRLTEAERTAYGLPTAPDWVRYYL